MKKKHVSIIVKRIYDLKKTLSCRFLDFKTSCLCRIWNANLGSRAGLSALFFSPK